MVFCWAQIYFLAISGSKWVIFSICSEFYFPILKKFFYLNFWPKNFDLKNWFFEWLKYSFSWSADHAESYPAFLANSIFQFQRNFFTSISDEKFRSLKLIFWCVKYSFSWWADHAKSYSAFVANFIFQVQGNFFHLNFWPKISILKFNLFIGSNIVFRD